MLTNTLRIGPLFLLEFVLNLIGLVLIYMWDLRCSGLSLIQISLIIFFVQTIISLQLIETDAIYRRKYIHFFSQSNGLKFYSTLLWNELNFVAIMLTQIWICISDGIILFNKNYLTCTFLQYPLCLQFNFFSIWSESVNYILLWITYVVYNCLLITLFAFAQYKQFNYFQKSYSKRISESLLPLQESEQKNQIKRKYDRCVICLNQMNSPKDLIRLVCKHRFHSDCLGIWWQKKQQCPYRCRID